MIAKKSKKANLERKRFAFFQIGLLVSGSLCLAAFEWSSVSPDEYVEILDDDVHILPPIVPEDDENVKIIRKVKPKAAVNLDNVDDVKVVKKLSQTGEVKTTTNEKITITDGDLYHGDDINLTIEREGTRGGKVWDIVEKEPEFPGGIEAMNKWLASEIDYPELPREMGIGGIQYIEFVVNTDGSIVNVKTVGSTHEDLAKEGERVVKKMPKWTPGEQAGKKVRVRYTLPINFVSY